MSKLFDHLNHIQYSQNRNYFNSLSTEEQKSFDVFMIVKFLSMDMNIIEIANYLNKYQYTWDKDKMYQVIISVLPTNNYDLIWHKNKKEKDSEDIKYIQELYDCTPTQAYEYFKILNKNEIDSIVRSFGIER